MLFHTTPTKDDEYSNADDVLKVAESRPNIRFCLAHCILFHRDYLDQADQAFALLDEGRDDVIKIVVEI